MVVSPLILTAPDEVLNNPVEEEASKFPEDWAYPVIFDSAPALIIKPLMVFVVVGAVIGWDVCNAPVESKYD